MTELRLGVLATSRKENELRLPIHPDHVDRIEPDLLNRMVFEAGYGQRFTHSNQCEGRVQKG